MSTCLDLILGSACRCSIVSWHLWMFQHHHLSSQQDPLCFHLWPNALATESTCRLPEYTAVRPRKAWKKLWVRSPSSEEVGSDSSWVGKLSCSLISASASRLSAKQPQCLQDMNAFCVQPRLWSCVACWRRLWHIAKPKAGPTVFNAFCMNCPWSMWDVYKCKSMKCHPCAGAMHGHECSAKCFRLLLGNVESLASISTPFWHGCCAQTSMDIPIWDCFDPSGIMVTGSCHYSPAWKSLPFGKDGILVTGSCHHSPAKVFLCTYVAL